MAAKGWRTDSRWDALLWKAAIPALALAILVIGVPDIPKSIDAARNEGRSGTFTSERSECDRRSGCTYYGTFVSDDSAVRLSNVFIDDGVHAVGETVPAQYVEGQKSPKVYEPNSRDWMSLGAILFASVLYLLGWGGIVVRPWLQRRRA